MAGFWRGVGVLVVAAGVGGACAAAPEDETEPETTVVSTVASTAAVGTGGGGGQGGSTGPCEQNCSAISTPQCLVSVCNEGQYQGTIGTCVVVPDEDDTPCDDGMFCTTNDTCQGSVCTGGPPNDCGMQPPTCEEVTCDEAADSCGTQPLANGTACVHMDLCLLGTTCTNGVCSGGNLNDCFFAPVPDDCHVAVCNPMNGMCEPVPGNEGDPCVDPNDLCTVNKTCTTGMCLGGNPKDCSSLTMGCTLGVCDTTNGMCMAQTVMNGQPCDDLDACTTGETCANSVCSNGAPVTVCEQNGDGCCPSNCTAMTDLDCACQTGQLGTPFVGGNGAGGNMFDITALKNIEVQGVDVSIGTSTLTIEVWYRPGSYVGFENSSAGWTLAGTASATGAGTNVPTPVPLTLAIPIQSGQTYGFYVTATSGSLTYTNGTVVGNVAASNVDLQIKEGVGKSYPFASTFTPRIWNGVVHYEQCGN